jgi:anti-sigma B factor antagonist
VKVEEKAQKDIALIHLSGEIDLHHSPKLRDFLLTKKKAKCGKLLIDFTDVNYIDSSGLATLVEYFQGSREYSGKIALTGMTARVRSVFDLVRLSEIFPIYTSSEEGITYLNS